ncbi:MAG: UvrD-helicase domain-containing protein [Bacilli bacterium]|jgi:ATP-dependent helicase/nuclease subunit A
MAPTWNDTQLRAIETRGANTIVSAGAGSGKTAVLTERVAQLVRQGHPIASLLVLTFTNAAAAEMKQRIRDRLANLGLNQEAAAVDQASIMTFDAYALSLVKRYHYALGLEPDVGILEERILDLLRKRTLASVFDRYYGLADTRFLDLVKAFAVRSDEGLRNLVLAFDRMADLKPDKRSYYENYLAHYFAPAYIDAAFADYHRWIDARLSDLLKTIASFGEASYRQLMVEEITAMALTEDFDLKAASIGSYSFPNTRKFKFDEHQKAALKLIKSQFKQLKDKAAIGSKQDLIARYLKTMPQAEMLVELAVRLDEEMTAFKQRYNRFSFADVAKMAIRLVSDEEIRRELKREIQFIMIDEYQDTNDLQDRFIADLAADNVFMVGDVKQSIYRFRNANCALFTQKYDDYRDSKRGQAIDMNTNYRSRREVITSINRLFGRLMKIDLGGVDYESRHEILFGQDAYDAAYDPHADYGLTVYGYESESANAAIEAEIRIIAQDIIAKRKQARMVFDNQEKTLRPIAFGDFAILIDRRSSFKAYARVFEEYGLPLEVQFVDEMRQSDVLNVFENLIRLVAGHGTSDYPSKYRHEFASAWRSFLYRYPDRVIFEKLKDLSHQSDDPLMEKIASIAREKARLPLGRLVEKIALDFELHQATIHLGDVLTHASRIEELIRLSEGLQDIGMSIDDLVAYFDDAAALNAPVVLDSPKSSHDAVKLMTIHQSKGLEFPVVYYPGLFKQFNLPEETASAYAHGRYGLVLPVYEEEKPYSFFHQLVRAEEKKSALSEELRKLYVALTRARETMVVLMRSSDAETMPMQPRSFADFLRLADWTAGYERSIPPLQKGLPGASRASTPKIEFRQLDLVPVIKTHTRASQTRVSNRLGARYGTRLHELMAGLDYARPSVEDIPEETMKKQIAELLSLAPLRNAAQATVYQEYSFYDPNQDLFGTIDLMLVYDDHIDLIDFKTGSLGHPEYDEQMRAYYRHVAAVSALPINLFLVSLTRVEYRPVDPKEDSA